MRNPFNTLSTLDVGGREYQYYDLGKLAAAAGKDLSRLPTPSAS